MEDAWQTPSELVNETIDLLGDRESETIQCYSAQLLHELTMHVEGCRNVMVDFCLTYLEKIADNSNATEIKYIDTSIIEACLLVLALLKDVIENNLSLQILVDRAMMKIIPVVCDFRTNHSPSNGVTFEQLDAKYKQFRTPIIQ